MWAIVWPVWGVRAVMEHVSEGITSIGGPDGGGRDGNGHIGGGGNNQRGSEIGRVEGVSS